MKKFILLATVLLGAVSVSQAGVHFSFGLGIPLGPPAVVYQAPPVYAAAAPVYAAPAPVYAAPAPVYTPAPPVVYASPPVVYSAPSLYLGFGHGWCGAPYRGYYSWGYRGGWGYHQGWHR